MGRVILDVKLNIKPLSANDMHYANKRIDTAKYRQFKKDIKDLVGGEYGIRKKTKLKLTVIAGYSSVLSDCDNCLKSLGDSLQLSMGFNDNQIYEIIVYKAIVKKKEEYLYVKLETIPGTRVPKIVNKILEKFNDE